jgi:hypothetical protein
MLAFWTAVGAGSPVLLFDVVAFCALVIVMVDVGVVKPL